MTHLAGDAGGEVRVGGRGFGCRERYDDVAANGLRLVEEQGGRRVQEKVRIERMNTHTKRLFDPAVNDDAKVVRLVTGPRRL